MKDAPFSHSKSILHLKMLNEVAANLQSLLGSDNFYQEVVDIIQNYFNFYCINIWSIQEDGLNYTLEAQGGAYREHLKRGHKIEVSQGIVGAVIRSKTSYYCKDVSTDAHYTNLSLPIDTKSELSVPILKSGQVVAAINVESDLLGAFDSDDRMALEALASQLAVAITNQKLFQESKSFNHSLQNAVEEKTQELRRAHERILDQQRLLQRENKALKTLVSQENKTLEIVGKSSPILNILAMVDKIAPTTATVLIQGESGTGKELIARRLHLKSERANRPYVTVNCGALQESLLESELFGHEKGAFTGAVNQKFGLCETADGGTLFMDEIGETSLGIQSKLLRFLQEGEFYRIGGKRPIKVDVRVISATNRDLEQEVKGNRFREDLFYRLNTITLRMPPLRKRSEDIPTLVEFFLKNSRFGGSANSIKKIDPRVLEAFARYDWPGNIRELQNTIERMKILSENQEIKLEDVPFGIRMPKSRLETSEHPLDLPLEAVEKSHILKILAYNHGNKTKSAQSLGITIKTLYNKLHRYGILKHNGLVTDHQGFELKDSERESNAV